MLSFITTLSYPSIALKFSLSWTTPSSSSSSLLSIVRVIKNVPVWSPPVITGMRHKSTIVVCSLQSSRLKKIKCLLPSPESKCEACKSAKIQCRFRDRERYFAERSRAIAGPNSGLYASDISSSRCALLETRPPTFFYDSTLPQV